MLTATPIIEIVGISRSFVDGSRQVHALRNVDLVVHAGECVALMGASGSGKSTLLNIISGIDTPNEGTVHVLGRDLTRSSSRTIADLRLKHIGYVFQNINLLPDLTLLENVTLPLEALGHKRVPAKAKALEQLDAVGVAHLRDRLAHQVSGGERQRAAIARAVVGDRSILLADEPTGSLDSATGTQVMDVIRKVCASGVAAVIGTHNALVADAADRTVTMRDGSLT